jgi:aquaporin Z
MFAKLCAEFIGTFWLVLGGCGSAVLAAAFPDVGIWSSWRFVRLRSYSLDRRLRARADFRRSLQSRRLGRTVGRRPLSGGAARPLHARPGGRRRGRRGRAVPDRKRSSGVQSRGRLASNGYGEQSPGQYSLMAGFVTEVVMTFMFLIVILGATHRRAPVGTAGLRSVLRLR